MRILYTNKLKNTVILKAEIHKLRKEYLTLLKTMKQQKAKKIQNKAYFEELAKSKKLKLEIKTKSELLLHRLNKMKFIKEKYLKKPDDHSMKKIPAYFTNMNIAVINKKKMHLRKLTYNITVVPNWVHMLRNKIHNYGKEYATTVNEYITNRAEWKENKKSAVKAMEDSDILARDYYFLIANANFKLQQIAGYSKTVLKNARKYLSACSIAGVATTRL